MKFRRMFSRARRACAALLVMYCALAARADTVASCAQKFPGADEAQKRLRYRCYDAAEALPPIASAETGVADQVADAPVQAAAANAPSRLDALWRTDKPRSLQPYRQNYLMMTHTGSPNNAPRSGNPTNNVPHTFDLRQNEAKFQLSVKALGLDATALEFLGGGNSLWFAYTQQSFWQIGDVDRSRPFRESNYEPEAIFSHRIEPGRRFGDLPAEMFGFAPRFLNFGLVHQSNGQSLPRSRSWNRAYAQLGMERSLPDGSSVAILVRPWVRLGERSGNDDNPDIGHYLGHGDIELLYWKNGRLLSLLGRRRSLQADLSIPFDREEKSLQLHLQYFTGYGESLIDYSQRHSVFGVGLSLPYR